VPVLANVAAILPRCAPIYPCGHHDSAAAVRQILQARANSAPSGAPGLEAVDLYARA